jgi:tetratricopeptide (TPR) repeat protein
MEQLMAQEDQCFYEQQNYRKAEALYQKATDLDPQNTEAINSLAACIQQQSQNVQLDFDEIADTYGRTLQIDPDNTEANFNLGLLFLQVKADLDRALSYFGRSVTKDDSSPKALLLRAQFAKAYFNMAVIYSKLGMHPEAAHNYKKAILKCQETPELRESLTYKKAATNYSIILERLGQRDQAIALLTELQATFNGEVLVANNIGILHKRQGDVDAAISAY